MNWAITAHISPKNGRLHNSKFPSAENVHGNKNYAFPQCKSCLHIADFHQPRLSVLLYNLAQYYSQGERWHDAVAALEEVVALDERTGHEDLASDRAALEQARRMAAATPEENSRLEAAADALAQIQSLADQARDAAIATLRGEFDRQTLLAWLDETAERAAADESPDAPWAQFAAYLRAVAALLRDEPTRTVPAAFAAHLDAIEAARRERA